MNDTDRSQAFSTIFQTIQQLKVEHAAQERRNVEALREAAKEIEAMLNEMQKLDTDNSTDVQEPRRQH